MTWKITLPPKRSQGGFSVSPTKMFCSNQNFHAQGQAIIPLQMKQIEKEQSNMKICQCHKRGGRKHPLSALKIIAQSSKQHISLDSWNTHRTAKSISSYADRRLHHHDKGWIPLILPGKERFWVGWYFNLPHEFKLMSWLMSTLRTHSCCIVKLLVSCADAELRQFCPEQEILTSTFQVSSLDCQIPHPYIGEFSGCEAPKYWLLAGKH